MKHNDAETPRSTTPSMIAGIRNSRAEKRNFRHAGLKIRN